MPEAAARVEDRCPDAVALFSANQHVLVGEFGVLAWPSILKFEYQTSASPS